MEATARERRIAELGLVAMVLIWGINFSVVKAVFPVVPPLAFNSLRFPMAALSIAILLVAGGRYRLPEKEDIWKVIVLGLIANVLYQSCFILGMDRTSAGNASLLLATTPAWTTILSTRVGHETVEPRVWVGVVGALVGIVFVVLGGGGAAFSFETLDGDLLMLAGALTWTVYTVGARPLIQRYGSMRVTAWTLWVGTLGIVPVGIPELGTVEISSLPWGAWLGLAYAGVFSISVAYALWNRGVRTLGNARTSVYSNTVPVIALITAWIWLGERPGMLQLVGAALILLSVSWAKRPGPVPGGGGPLGIRKRGSPGP